MVDYSVRCVMYGQHKKGRRKLVNMPKQINNGDNVRSMTNEQLAEWYWWMLKYVQNYTDSRIALIDWLNEEYYDK
jgi:hypothetical protein